MRRTTFAHRVEYALTLGFFYLMRALPLPLASAVTGAMARTIGPYIRRSALARRQMKARLTGATDADIRRYERGMWDNLGRVFAEYPHLHRSVMDARIQVIGQENLPHDRPFLIVSGHYGNWEMLPRVLSMLGKPVHVVYRPPNNPLTHGLIDRIRSRYSLGHYGKGREGARGVMAAFRSGESVAILIDQKDNAGALLNFMGAPAMTMTSAAKLALKLDVPVIPMLMERTQGAYFTAHILPEIPKPHGPEDPEVKALHLMQAMNDMLGAFVAQRPAQWFWLHRRWPKDA